MLSNGTDLRVNAPDVAPGKITTASEAFARRRPSRFGLSRLLAGIPLIAVATFVAVGPAPAETNMVSSADVAQLEQPAPVQAQPRWSMSSAKALLAAVEASEKEGLNPRDYSVDALRSAIDADQKGPALDTLANAAAMRLAHDYANGRIDDKAAYDWHLGNSADTNMLATGLNDALDADRLGKWLKSLLPDSEQYRALKAAYADADPADAATRDMLRANLERWRWMPRDLGQRYIYVNVPSYQLELMNGGVTEATYNVVVGAPKTPTPQLALQAQSVVANPSWTLPPSVLKEGNWRNKGYTATKIAGGYRVVQAPGPTNALGRIKIDMPNEHAIYLHDTPNKAAFNREQRALSHGCVRVQNIAELAATLSNDSGDLDAALENPRQTKVLQLQRSMPVYIVYFTAQANDDGTLRRLPDPYGRDRQLIAQLGGMGGGAPVRMAAR